MNKVSEEHKRQQREKAIRMMYKAVYLASVTRSELHHEPSGATLDIVPKQVMDMIKDSCNAYELVEGLPSAFEKIDHGFWVPADTIPYKHDTPSTWQKIKDFFSAFTDHVKKSYPGDEG